MIYNLIVTYPGVSFNDIMNIFELTDSNLRYHLNYLEKHGKISPGQGSGSGCYYPHPTSIKLLNVRQEPIESRRLTAVQQRLLGIIKEHPQINQKELVKRSGMNRMTAVRNLNTLRDLNLIKNRTVSNNVYYEYVPDPELKFVYLKGLILKFLNDEIDEETFLRLKSKLDKKC